MKLCPICLSEYSDEHTTCPSDNARLIETKEWQPGQMVANNKYLIVAKIGRGGMGTVFKASHVALDEIRAPPEGPGAPVGNRLPRGIRGFRDGGFEARTVRPRLGECLDVDKGGVGHHGARGGRRGNANRGQHCTGAAGCRPTALLACSF